MKMCCSKVGLTKRSELQITFRLEGTCGLPLIATQAASDQAGDTKS
jgi:hypothetical protein